MTEKKEIWEHPMFTEKKRLLDNGWSKKYDGWLDAPFWRNVTIFGKDGREDLVVSFRTSKAKYLNTEVGVYGNFKPITNKILK